MVPIRTKAPQLLYVAEQLIIACRALIYHFLFCEV